MVSVQQDGKEEAMSERIVLDMTREQAQAVMNATELLARLHIGQFREITNKFIDKLIQDGHFDRARRERIDELLEQAFRTLFGVNAYNRPDIGEKNIEFERLWAIYATIRYTLSWHDNPEGNPWSVAFDPPMGYGEEMPKCKIEDEQECDKEQDSSLNFRINEYLTVLKRYDGKMTRQEYKTLRGQAISGDIDGAYKGLDKMIKRR